MRNPHPGFICMPSVVCVGTPTEVTVVPQDNARIFEDDTPYELCVAGLFDHRQEDYHKELPFDVPCQVKNGYLTFTYTFPCEQEYTLRFRQISDTPKTKYQEVSVYAVEKDLYERRPLKGDLHTHSYYSDGRDDTAMTVADYREEGFDFFALTDHNRYYTGEMAREAFKEVSLGIRILSGEEVHAPGSLVHIIHIGGRESVCDIYRKHPEQYQAEVAEIEQTLEDDNAFYRHRLAMSMWVCRKIHEVGGTAIFPHPFWKPDLYSVQLPLCDRLFKAGMFDAVEVVGGMNCEKDNLTLALWQQKAMQGMALPTVGSSDSHLHDSIEKWFGNHYSYVFAVSDEPEDILQAIRDGYCVAAEQPAGSNDVRFFSKEFRLVAFSHFLYRNYFNQTWCICNGEGNLMRRYLRDEIDGSVLSALHNSVSEFYERFYGKQPPVAFSARRQAFRDKWRKVQQDGPLTKGGMLYIYGKNERRL